MPLPSPSAPRQRLHVRSVVYEGWQREDGMFDIEARLVDTKDHDYELLVGTRPAATPNNKSWAEIPNGRDVGGEELFAAG